MKKLNLRLTVPRFVTDFADAGASRRFHGAHYGGTVMNAGMPTRPDRAERIVGGMLTIVLLAGVVWALIGHGAAPGIDLHALLG